MIVFHAKALSRSNGSSVLLEVLIFMVALKLISMSTLFCFSLFDEAFFHLDSWWQHFEMSKTNDAREDNFLPQEFSDKVTEDTLYTTFQLIKLL